MAAFIILSLPAILIIALAYSWVFDKRPKFRKKKCKRVCHAHVFKLIRGEMAILDYKNCDECKKALYVANIW